VSTVVDGDGATVTNTFTQQDVTTTLSPAPAGENNKGSTVEVDGLGRVVSSCAILNSGGSACGQVSGGSGIATTMVYSTAAGTSTVTATRGSESKTIIKDAMGRVTSSKTPEKTAAVTYVYNATTGLLSSSVDNGTTTTTHTTARGVHNRCKQARLIAVCLSMITCLTQMRAHHPQAIRWWELTQSAG
jgi:hypothetical protein